MLVIALLVAGYASVDRSGTGGANLRLGAVNAEGLVIGEGGSVGSVALGRSGTIVKPMGVPTSAPVSHAPITYQVQPGEKLQDIAARYHVSTEAIRWSNYGALRNLGVDVSPGMIIVIPPVNGVVVTIKAGDTPRSLAAAYHVDPDAVVDFNYVRTGQDTELTPGAMVVVPGGRGGDFERPVSRSSVGAYRPVVAVWSGGSGNRFAFGYCTWYVYNRRPVPWLGNAWEWFGQAQAYGWRTGGSPAPGAIMVTWESPWGHVAYVESVNSNGSWTVSEMNYRAWDVVDYRTIFPGQVPLIGFIYGP